MRGEGELERRISDLAVLLPAPSAAAVTRETRRLARYLALVLAANERMNLVSSAAARPEELVGRHLFDALLGLHLLPPPGPRGLLLLDIGSGGGFPALPLLLVRDDLRGTLVESTGKKARFLEESVRTLSLAADVVKGRFPSGFPRVSAPYDVLTTRAVASAGRLLRAARPFLAASARALLWTTKDLLEEIRRESGRANLVFEKAPGTEKRGIAVLGATAGSAAEDAVEK